MNSDLENFLTDSGSSEDVFIVISLDAFVLDLGFAAAAVTFPGI
jgi:hypothetical protein